MTVPRTDPDGTRLPVKLDSTSNGEFEPIPLSPANRAANHLAHEHATHNAKQLGLSRRDFLVSSCGVASTLLAFNRANAAAGKPRGWFDLDAESAFDAQLAAAQFEGDEFIFDVQGHFVDRIQGTHRLMLHGRVNPNQPGDVEAMDVLKERWGVCAWKTYTQWGPDGRGFFLSDDIGIRFIEKARALGVNVICVHKGLPFGRQSYEHSQCSDIGVVAKRFPDVSFLIYHSGFVAGNPELPYDHAAARDGIDTLVRSLIENDVAPNSNVYAELGSTWRFVMRDPDSAAHTLGKLFKYAGENNVLWGTDSIWYGSPQDQIQAFRTFQIAPELRSRYGYPEITPALRAKVFGLNATRPYAISVEEVRKYARRDRIAHERLAYRERPEPHFLTYGPRTRREFLNLLRWNGGSRA
jgi:hypothetical protein